MVRLHDEANNVDRLDVRIIFAGPICAALRKAAAQNCRSIQQEIRYRIETMLQVKRGGNG